ncbi:conserved hypothetical protein (DUF302) [Formosa agariphila KMM 3901]|uniref:DUF302 domain-containing protein n=1 Tax=Formosa agariphila (strain DSM 15362 / KCTC 12365 / LMG 23005 / KMM 3901 / M-2Alg 35-1) TaxID=1347342 RepID=T2KMX9_FORAG|nr:DUF302 domain-containing protein [Formosa agariphila]CDF79319.1 conserved hypothetical protein (DUF302) [Formosa agariphila KMM 3901]
MKTLTLTSIFFSALLLITSCDSDDDKSTQIPDNDTPETAGIGYSETNEDPTNIYNAITATLNANDNIGIVAEVNHSANAQNAGLSLDYTRTVYFGNPALGTPLMQDNIQAGLDLPQRISVYTDEDNHTVVTYNSVDYIINRHSLGTVSSTEMIENALANIVESATGEAVVLNPIENEGSKGIVSVASSNDFDTTYNNIINTLNNLEPISIMAELDHQANAESIGMELMPAKLIIFGNPVLGTPLMNESRTMALDLPQKMLVYQDAEGKVHIIYNDPFYLAERHDVDDNDDTLETISQALENIANSGASES